MRGLFFCKKKTPKIDALKHTVRLYYLKNLPQMSHRLTCFYMFYHY
ncbi:hypothetical protein FM106_18835 [Brachybacterium faecium]|nr:hypothetical protein FM106_18835 [Brachybacterium faecium]